MFGHAPSSESICSATSSSTCSQLSTTNSTLLVPMRSRTCLSIAAPASGTKSIAFANVSATASSSPTGARSTKYVPSVNATPSRAATSIASRVFPHPPAPVIVTSRLAWSNARALVDLVVSAQEAGPLRRQRALDIGERPNRRELRRQAIAGELKQMLGTIDIAQPVLTEIDEPHAARRRASAPSCRSRAPARRAPPPSPARPDSGPDRSNRRRVRPLLRCGYPCGPAARSRQANARSAALAERPIAASTADPARPNAAANASPAVENT